MRPRSDQTRLLLFGRFAAAMRGRRGLRPETFEFLGFKHVCGMGRTGRFALIGIRSTKSCKKFLARTREWLLAHRHWKRREQQHYLTVMLRGFYQYFALHHCELKLSAGLAVQIFDSWAGILPAGEFEMWCIRPHARIIEKVRSEVFGARIIGFPRGAV